MSVPYADGLTCSGGRTVQKERLQDSRTLPGWPQHSPGMQLSKQAGGREDALRTNGVRCIGLTQLVDKRALC